MVLLSFRAGASAALQARIGVLILAVFTLTAQAALPKGAAIASAHPLATQAGFEILAQGGNAFDAAVAVSAALAVVEPSGSGLGGGGFWLLHRDSDGFEIMLDGREKAPLAAQRDMYLDASGKAIADLSKDGALAAAIPGLPAALAHLAEKYGRLPLAASLQPAIRYAQQGFTINSRYLRQLGFRAEVLKKSPEAARIFLNNGALPQAGATLKQPDLALTLEQFAQRGKAGFYGGAVAEKLLRGVRAAGGIWSRQDLKDYAVVERRPVHGVYRGIKITGAAPPSSGGIVLIEALNILAYFDLTAFDEATRKHLIAEALRRAYHDRALYLGDADFVNIPLWRLIGTDYAAGLASAMRPDKALPSDFLSGDMNDRNDGQDTTHFSIIDNEGNRVAATLSVNFPFGSGFVAPGTGVLLNDEMDDFAVAPGTPNAYGLIGGDANSIAPGKRMLSSMTPTFLDDGRRVAVLGTPGGSRIISMVLLAVLDFAAGHGPESWVAVPRFHHQYLPDHIEYEEGGLTPAEIAKLTRLGHRLQQTRYRYGDMQGALWDRDSGQLSAASDPRGEGGEGAALVK
jgi:gamma-glutamyltranspeptidase/glutathione hydrolase